MAKAHLLIDNFNDNATDATKWTVVAGPAPTAERISEVNQRLEIRPRASVSGVNLSYYQSAALWDVTASEVRVEVVQALSQAIGTATFLSVGTSGTDEVFLTIEDGYLMAGQDSGGSYYIFNQVPYDPAKHRWLRLRNLVAGGVAYWEYSADGEHFETLWNGGSPVDLSAVYVYIGAGTQQDVEAPGFAVFDNFNVVDATRERRVEERRLSARALRQQAAKLASRRDHDTHVNNNDETNLTTRPFAGNYSKSLKHDSLGDPDPYSYGTLLRALESRDPADFEEIVLASSTALKLTNPQAGFAFELEGADAQEVVIPPAPGFDSEQTAHEEGELYWMAVARDVYFGNYATDPIITAAISSLNTEFPAFGGTLPVTAQNVFRGVYPGEQVGPYVSQFLLKGNVDQRKPAGQGRNAADGFVSYGSRTIDQRQFPAVANVDYLHTFASWLNAQNGVDARGTDTFDTTRRFIRNLRDGATFVHFDQVLDAWYNAAWILMSEPTGNQSTFVSGTTGRPQVDLEFPYNPGNPYDPPGTAEDSRTQAGFTTFGQPHLLSVLGEVLARALRATWWQKWGVHRRLRPEEYGGRVHNHITGARTYPLHTSITTSLTSGGLAPYFGNVGEKFPNGYLLPQAYPEGAPTHPAYAAGHATGSAACATILKAFFDESKAIENPVIANSTGLSLIAYTGPDAGSMTVGGELNKLAGNIAIFRNAAGVHWRSDYTESLVLGEAVAIRLLQEMSLTFNEDDGYFQLTRFDGNRVRIHDGKVQLLLT